MVYTNVHKDKLYKSGQWCSCCGFGRMALALLVRCLTCSMCFSAMNWALKARSDGLLTHFSDKEVQGRLLSQPRHRHSKYVLLGLV